MNKKYIMTSITVFIILAVSGAFMMYYDSTDNVVQENNGTKNGSVNSENSTAYNGDINENVVKNNVKSDKKNLISKNQAVNIVQRLFSNKIKITSAKLDKDDYDNGSYVWKIYFDDKVAGHSFYVAIDAKSGEMVDKIPYGGGGALPPNTNVSDGEGL